MIKKIVSIFTVLTILLQLCLNVHAIKDEPKLSLSVTTTGYNKGDIVTVTCYYSGLNVTPYSDDNGIGDKITGVQVSINIPGGIGTETTTKQFLRSGVTNTTGFSSGSPLYYWDIPNGTFTAAISDIDDPSTPNGKVFEISMKLNRDITEDLSFSFVDTYDQVIVYDNYTDWAAGDTVQNKFTGDNLVSCTICKPSIKLRGSANKFKPGDKITLYFDVENNPGIISLYADLKWDNSVSLISVTDKKIFRGSYLSNTYKSPYKLNWSDDFANADNTISGTFAKLVFEVADNAVAGSTHKIVLFSDDDNTINYNLDNVHFSPTSFEYTIDKTDIDDDSSAIDDKFQVDMYRANYLIDSQIGKTMEEKYLNFDTPSKTIVETGKKNGLSSMAGIWKLVTGGIDAVDDPKKLAEFAFEQKDVYEAIIMDLLKTSVDIRIMECINNDITESSKKLTDNVISNMKNIYKYDEASLYKDISKMDDDFINHLEETISNNFKKEHVNAYGISKFSSFLSKTIKYATDLEKYCETAMAYFQMLQLSSSMKSIVRNMYNECSYENLGLKSALMECNRILCSSEENFANSIAAGLFCVAGLNVGEYYFDKMWDGITAKFMIVNPSAFVISAAYKTGKYVTNTVFNTDTITEKYYKLAALNEVEKLLIKIYGKTKHFYQTKPTVQLAQNYNSVIELMFNMMDIDCDYSIEYLKETDDTLVAQVKYILNNNDTGDAIKYVQKLQQDYSYYWEKVSTDWILTLPSKYPSEFAKYSPVLRESLKKQKAYFVNCPVDVYVYDKNGVLVASAVNNIPYCKNGSNITIATEGDKKIIYFYDENEYDMVYKGNDTGKMDITVTEYDDLSSKSRNVYFNNLELTKDLAYTSSESGVISQDNEYIILNNEKENIIPDYDSSTNVSKEFYAININGGYITDTLAIAQKIHDGENINITAYVPEGYRFVNWTSDAKSNIFEDANSITTKVIMPNYDVNITANLIAIPSLSISEITENSVTIKTTGNDDINDGIIILAIYDKNNNLESVKTNKFAENITFNNLKLTRGNMKVMLWNNLKGLYPLADTKEKLFTFDSQS